MNTTVESHLRTLPPIARFFNRYPHNNHSITHHTPDQPQQPSMQTSSNLPSYQPSSTPSPSKEIPPLQGYDPPRALRVYGNNRTSGTSLRNTIHNSYGSWRPAFLMIPKYEQSPQHQPSLSPSTIPFSGLSPPTSAPSPPSSSSANTITSMTSSISDVTPLFWDQQENEEDLGPPNTEIMITDTGEVVLKRRRGRPPTSKTNNWHGGWRFLAPTVWTVQPPPHAPGPPCAEPISRSIQHTAAPLTLADDVSHSIHMTAFTGMDMNTIMRVPQKKRGRKPKRQLAGHSCFAWKDIPATPRAKRKKEKEDQQELFKPASE